MSELKGLLLGMAIAAILYVLMRYLPKWFGAIPMILFLGFMIWVMVTSVHGSLIAKLVVLVVGESVLGTIWDETNKQRQKRFKTEIEKMQAKDYSSSKKNKKR
ncbi:integral membrane protein [Secundilactobacillus pentosiphilus]|uniref:Integral membrane protein n=1 Tax=Secundilactobacillus pentosiphilus TaxID=1714682 RepID=A0A1Z5IYP0_9LACO|nr:hypothetical protein [Secundilactobacillus pentosiphilus]GAX06867.1 integral membrane protein [Secundilactobacillus pentosiphilus]